MEFFKKDTYYLGAIVGIVLPVIVYGLVYLIDIRLASIWLLKWIIFIC